MKTRCLFTSFVVGLGLVLALLWALESRAAPEVQLALDVTAPGAERQVCLSGCAYSSVQDAVDAANAGDVVKVAQGTYTGVQFRGWTTQTVYISKTITIRGGYTTTNWSASYPLTQPTTLDAQGQGRVFYIAEGISVTIDGLRITGGNTAQGGLWESSGGGLYVARSDIALLNNAIVSNTASGGNGRGGGVYVYESNLTMANSAVLSNTAGEWGGGMHVEYSGTIELRDNTFAYNTAEAGGGFWFGRTDATLTGNTIVSNTAVRYGGGLYLWDSRGILSDNTVGSNGAGTYGGGVYLDSSDDALLDGNTVISNVAGVEGGGLRLSFSDAMLNGNTISYNRAEGGGGLDLNSSDAALVNNTIISNTAIERGGGLDLSSSEATLISNTISYNQVEQPPSSYFGGGGLCLNGSDATLIGNTIDHNSAPWGGGLFLGSLSDALLRGNRITDNQATDEFGGGMVIYRNESELVNNVIVDNQAATEGSGIYVRGSAPVFLHNTIARNTAGDGSGLYVCPFFSTPSSVVMTNTILVSQTMGIDTESNTTITVTGILWSGNGTNVAGSGTIVVTDQYTGTPAFVDPDAGDYHILATSAAKDSGVSTDELFDLDGDYRPLAAPPDLGADEVVTTTPECKARLNGGTVYTTIQAAVGASSAATDLVEVAGVCEDSVVWDGGIYVAVLTKTLTLRGGYSPADFTWNPVSHTTTLNGRSQGSVLAIVGEGITPTVEHLTLLGGQAVEGGGVWVANAGPTLQNLLVTENTAAHGGGLYLTGVSAGSMLMSNTIQSNIAALGGGGYLRDSDATVSKNTFAGNRAQGSGGGLYLYQSAAVLSESIIDGNDAVGSSAGSGGGGMYLWYSDADLSGNAIRDNTSGGYGGGIYLRDESDAVLSDNTIISNTAGQNGGAVYLQMSDSTIEDNTIFGNVASSRGGGMYLGYGDVAVNNNTILSNTSGSYGGGLYLAGLPVTLSNNVVADNYAKLKGSGVYIDYSSSTLLHTTIARNTGGDGSGVHITYYSVVTLTNTIVVDHAIGVTVTEGCTATLDSVLWFGNGVNIGGPGAFQVTGAATGDPAFAADGYHLAGGSAAISAGRDAGVTEDIDGEVRPMGDGYELGADEVLAVFVDSGDGDTMVYTDTQGLTTTVQIPTDAVTMTTQLVYLPVISPTDPLSPGLPLPGRVFDLDAFCYPRYDVYLPLVLRGYSGDGLSVNGGSISARRYTDWRNASCTTGSSGPAPCQPAFLSPITITIYYSEADIAGLVEEDLRLYRWTGSDWEDAADTCIPASTYITDTVANMLQVPICHLSRYGMR
jgi:parallel beta-helix repeat protein